MLSSYRPFKSIQKRTYTSLRKDFAEKHITPAISRMTDYEIIKAEGTFMYSSCGKKLLDFTAGIGVLNLGHCHPFVVDAIKKQVSKAMHVQIGIAWHTPMLDLVEKLPPIMPSQELDSFFFWDSGAEAVEAACKLARQAQKKPNIMVFEGSFHGRTFGSMTMTTCKTIYSAGFGPHLPGIIVGPQAPRIYEEQLRYGKQLTEDQIVSYRLEDVERYLKTRTAPSDTAAFLIEPVLGEGGYIPCPKNFMKGLKDIAVKNDILLIADEVQSGMGRTGKMWAMEYMDVTPDILIFAKGIASGLPLSGIAAKYALMAKQPPGSMGGTFAGNAVSCTSALATIEVFQSENILGNVNERSEQFFSALRKLAKEFPQIGDIRGLGLMIGVEFAGVPAGFGKKFSKMCSEEGLLLLTCGTYDQAVRFIPPLNVNKTEVDMGMAIFEKVLRKMVSDLPKK